MKHESGQVELVLQKFQGQISELKTELLKQQLEIQANFERLTRALETQSKPNTSLTDFNELRTEFLKQQLEIQANFERLTRAIETQGKPNTSLADLSALVKSIAPAPNQNARARISASQPTRRAFSSGIRTHSVSDANPEVLSYYGS